MILCIIRISGKKYSCIDFAAACIMSFGLIVFILGDSAVSPMFNPFGYAMISIALLFDAVIGNIQEKSLHAYKATTNEMVSPIFIDILPLPKNLKKCSFMQRSCSRDITEYNSRSLDKKKK